MKLRRTAEDYLKTIYLLSQKAEVHGTYIAEALGVSKPTVSISLKALEQEGYLMRDENRAFFIHRGDNKTDLIQMSVQHNVIMAVRISKLSNDVIIMINTHLGVFSKLPRGNVHRLLP